jgi:serine/threonine-protein kinase
VHRDLKPGNLFVARRADGTSRVKVVDFGISKVASTLARAERALTTALIGSPFYMSPEQLRGDAALDGRSDIWSLGLVLFELLTGEGPFEAPTMPELCVQIMIAEPRRLSEVRADIPVALESIVAKCLKKDPDARFLDADALADALRPFARELAPTVALKTPALNAPVSAAAPKRARTSVVPIAIGIGAVLVAAITTGAVLASRSQPALTASAWPIDLPSAAPPALPLDQSPIVDAPETAPSVASAIRRIPKASAAVPAPRADEFGGRK